MTQIDPSVLAAVIRRQVSSLARTSAAAPAGRAHSSRGAASSASSASRSAAAESSPDIASVVARRVHAIDPADPDRHCKAFRVFLESVLLAEFGANLVNDAGFHRLVEDVHTQMNTDPELAESIASATTRMLAPTSASGAR